MYFMFGPLTMAVKMLECAMFRSYCRSRDCPPDEKKNEHFIRCAIINTQNLKVVMRVIQIKLQGMHVYLQALSEITAWKKADTFD